jgi:hypothetical protein
MRRSWRVIVVLIVATLVVLVLLFQNQGSRVYGLAFTDDMLPEAQLKDMAERAAEFSGMHDPARRAQYQLTTYGAFLDSIDAGSGWHRREDPLFVAKLAGNISELRMYGGNGFAGETFDGLLIAIDARSGHLYSVSAYPTGG